MNYWTEQSDEDLRQLIRQMFEIKKDNPDIMIGLGMTQQQAEFATSKLAYANFIEGQALTLLALDPKHKYLKESDMYEMIQESMKNLMNDKRMRKLIEEVGKEQNDN